MKTMITTRLSLGPQLLKEGVVRHLHFIPLLYGLLNNLDGNNTGRDHGVYTDDCLTIFLWMTGTQHRGRFEVEGSLPSH